MSATTEAGQEVLERTRGAAHPECVVCGRGAPCGLGLEFALCADGSVEALFTCREALQGYAGMLHGGISAALLDGAMTNCLFAHGIVAVTGRMTVRFRRPVELAKSVVVRGYITRSQPPLYTVGAEILDEGRVLASAEAKFMRT